MPCKANEACRHKIPRARYKVINWPEYDKALQQRGSLTVWVTPEALAAWHPRHTGQRGCPRGYADPAIKIGHLLRLAFGQPWRQTEGLLRSLVTLLGLNVGLADHTTFSPRSPGPLASVTTDGAYDGEPFYWVMTERQPDPPMAVIIPPRSTAVSSPNASTAPSQRDQHIRMIGDKGRMGVQKAVGYGRRSHAETAMFRFKAIIGSSLRAQTLPAQKTEAKVACSVLNRMTRLGRPMTQRIA